MTFEIKFEGNFNSIADRLDDIQRNQIPFSTSVAMQKTVQIAAAEAAKTAERDLDNPTPQFTKPQTNQGWIRAVWPSKRDVQRDFRRANGSSAEARVFIIPALVDELHWVVYGGRQTNVPEGGDSVITPTRLLIQGLSGRGRLKKLNKFGNIAGFRNGILNRLRDNDQEYLNVPLNNAGRATRHLQPGLYFKVREVASDSAARRGRATRLTRTRRELSSRQRARGQRIKTSLVMLLAYSRSRFIAERKWRFDRIVRRSYDDNYARIFNRELGRAIATARPRRRRR